MTALRDLIARHKAGERVGITSVCSAHPLVIEATLQPRARERRTFGPDRGDVEPGQPGWRLHRHDARRLSGISSLRIADRVGFPRERMVLGGDHLGPNAWTACRPTRRWQRPEVMVADYVARRLRKIHLDCSMSCADDPVPLSERTIAERAAQLCQAAEAAFAGEPADAPSYVIGTEVPVPGGAAEELDELAVTTPRRGAGDDRDAP